VSTFSVLYSDTAAAPMAPAAIPSVVLSATRPTYAKSPSARAPSSTVKTVAAVPTLNPYQPNASTSVPSTAKVSEWPGMTFAEPSSLYRSTRGPST